MLEEVFTGQHTSTSTEAIDEDLVRIVPIMLQLFTANLVPIAENIQVSLFRQFKQNQYKLPWLNWVMEVGG